MSNGNFLAVHTEGNLANAKSRKLEHFNDMRHSAYCTCLWPVRPGVLLYWFTASHINLIMSLCFTQQHSCLSNLSFPSVTLLSLFLYSPPPTILSFLLPSLMMPFPFISFPSCCGRHARTDILITSARIPHLICLFLPLLLPHINFTFSFSLCFCLPFFCCLHAGDWNASFLCLRSWCGPSPEKYQSKNYSLTVRRSHCGAD